MVRYKIQIGQRFERGVVICRAARASHWVLKCDCGNIYEAFCDNLKHNRHKSCGCYRRQDSSTVKAPNMHKANTLSKGEGGLRALFATYKHLAKKKPIDFTLSIDEFKNLTSSNCYYCGAIPNQKRGNTKGNGKLRPDCIYIYNGIDRQDNSRGYVIDNCVPCCGTCNYMKHTSTSNEFLAACENIVNHQNRKNAAEMTAYVTDSDISTVYPWVH